MIRVGQWVGIESDDVGPVAFCNLSGVAVQVHQRSIRERGGANGFDRLHAEFCHVRKLAPVIAVRVDSAVVAEAESSAAKIGFAEVLPL